MSQAISYHYLPSSDFVCDRLDKEESEVRSKQTGVTIKISYQLEHFSEVSMPSEAKNNDPLCMVKLMKELDLGVNHLPNMLWTAIKY